MEKVTFYSYKPYLSICLHRERGIFVTFSAECSYSPSDSIRLRLLRQYAERTKGSYLISESMTPEELGRLHAELERKEAHDAQEREEARLRAEKERQEAHDFYSLLRTSDRVCR